VLSESVDLNADGTADETTNQTYDANGKLLRVNYSDDGGSATDYVINFTHDANGNLLTENNGRFSYIRTFSYDADGNEVTNSIDSNADGTVNGIYTSEAGDTTINHFFYWGRWLAAEIYGGAGRRALTPTHPSACIAKGGPSSTIAQIVPPEISVNLKSTAWFDSLTSLAQGA